jgi:glyoxylase-like metal-dependent hydrolase (beta-lactamase superfamily II)
MQETAGEGDGGGVADSTMHVTGIAQHALRGTRQVPPVEQVRADVWSIPIPMLSSPIRYTLIYALAGTESLVLVDAGWESDEGWEALVAGLDTLGASVADVRGVLGTHHHLDHVGLARRVVEASGAWFGMHPDDADFLAAPEYCDPPTAQRADRDWMRRLGATSDEIRQVMDARAATWERRRQVARADVHVGHGDLLPASGHRVRALHVPGHTPGQLCLVAEGAGLLFSGDHLLPRISPNVSAYHRADKDALGDFLGSLERVRSVGDLEVLPAHEWRFRGVADRADQILAHHQTRLGELVAVVRRSPGLTAWQIAAELTWSRSWDQYDGFLLLSAVNETMAHLMHLVRTGSVRLVEEHATARFALTDGARRRRPDRLQEV